MDKQKFLFEIIKSTISDNQRLAEMIGELLGTGVDSAYRRIRGETELSFSELIKICDRFNLSVDEILNHKTSNRGVLFHYTPICYPNRH